MFLVAAFEGNVSGNEHAFLEDWDRVGEHVNVEDAASRRIGDAVEIAADAHHALMRDAPFELQDRSDLAGEILEVHIEIFITPCKPAIPYRVYINIIEFDSNFIANFIRCKSDEVDTIVHITAKLAWAGTSE